MERPMPDAKPLGYRVTARRPDAHGSLAICKGASITPDTDLGGREDAFNLPHENVKKYGTVFNTVAPGTQLNGRLERARAPNYNFPRK
jgi:hypothetical protein